MLKLRCPKKLELACWKATRGLYSRCVFTAEVIPYQEYWKGHYSRKLELYCHVPSPEHTRSHISKTPGFFADFAVILVHSACLMHY